jgi:hypothetical protein
LQNAYSNCLIPDYGIDRRNDLTKRPPGNHCLRSGEWVHYTKFNVEDTIKFIEYNKDKPFCQYVVSECSCDVESNRRTPIRPPLSRRE